MKEKKVFIFDIGGVLINYDIELLKREIKQKYKIRFNQVNNIFSHNVLFDVETGQINCHDFFKIYVKKNIGRITYNEWISFWMDNYSINNLGVDLLNEIKNRGNKVYILSNLAEYNTIALKNKFPNFFNMCSYNFFSYELGYHKPDINIFKKVINKLNISAEACVFFDDIKDNIEGAKKAGMIGIHYSNNKIREIKKLVNSLLLTNDE